MKKLILWIMIICMSVQICAANILFYDVDTQSEGGKAIYAMSEKGIIAGYGNGFFGPDDTLTRAQAVKIINRVFMYEQPGSIEFTDVTEDAWYYNDVAIAVNAGYISGYGNGLFGPDDTLTREQICVMLDNVMHFTMLPVDVTINDEISHWASDSVKKMMSNFLISTDENGNFRATEEITREETCIILSQFVLEELPELPEFNLEEVAREELEGRLTRVIAGVREYLIPKTDKENVKALFELIAVNMECYLADPGYDYKTGSTKAKAVYGKLPKDERKEAKNLMVSFFLDSRYMEDLDVLYEFFF